MSLTKLPDFFVPLKLNFRFYNISKTNDLRRNIVIRNEIRTHDDVVGFDNKCVSLWKRSQRAKKGTVLSRHYFWTWKHVILFWRLFCAEFCWLKRGLKDHLSALGIGARDRYSGCQLYGEFFGSDFTVYISFILSTILMTLQWATEFTHFCSSFGDFILSESIHKAHNTAKMTSRKELQQLITGKSFKTKRHLYSSLLSTILSTLWFIW